MTKITKLLEEINDEKKVFGFKILKKPDNLQTILLCIKYFLLRVVFISKIEWKKLVFNAINENNKGKSLINVFIIGLFNFFASPPISFILILPLTFGSLLYILDKQDKQSIKKQLFTIIAFLFGYFVSIFWWFFFPLLTDFKHLFWLTPFAILGLPFIMSILFIPFFLLFLIIWNKLCKSIWFEKIFNKIFNVFGFNINHLGDFKWFFIFIFSWFCGEYVRGHIIFGGFPWMMFGHFITYSIAMQSVRLFDIDLYSVLFLSLVLTPYFLVFKRKNKFLQNFSIFIIFIWIVNCFVGTLIVFFTPSSQIKSNIIGSQPNHEASLTLERDAIEILKKNIQIVSLASHFQKDTIVIMPESSINQSINSGDDISKIIGNVLPNDRSILLGGGIYTEHNYDNSQYKFYNVVYAINQDGNIIDLYKKQKLVPFGEYLPIRKIVPNELIDIFGGFIDLDTDGENNLFVFYRDLPIIYPTICYESIFPKYIKNNIQKSRKAILELDDEYLKNNDIKNINERGELIVNLTNDVWMGHSFGVYQHFLMARFLAVSTGLPVVRVSNNGISAFIEKTGIVKEKTKSNKKDILYIKNI